MKEKTPLYIAAEKGNEEIVRQLLEVEGIDVNKAPTSGYYEGKTPLYIAAVKGNEEIVRQLLEVEGIDVNKAPTSGYYEGKTSLYIAAEKGNEEIVRQLLEVEGIDVNKAPTSGYYEGKTPLYIAAEKGHAEIVLQLIAYGVDETLLTEEHQARYAELIVNGKAIYREKNTKDLKSTIVNTARSLAKISPVSFREDQKKLAGHLSIMPNAIIAKITEFKEVSKDPHNLTVEQREKLRFNSVEYARKKPEARQGRELHVSKEAMSVFRLREQDPVSELIVRIGGLETKGIDLSSINISNIDGTYMYHYDADNGSAAMAEKPLTAITSSENAELLERIGEQESRLLELDPKSVTAIEVNVSFLEKETSSSLETKFSNGLGS